MSRESEERKAMLNAIEDSPRGAGDPDFYGYPGQPQHDIIVITDDRSLEQLVAETAVF